MRVPRAAVPVAVGTAWLTAERTRVVAPATVAQAMTVPTTAAPAMVVGPGKVGSLAAVVGRQAGVAVVAEVVHRATAVLAVWAGACKEGPWMEVSADRLAVAVEGRQAGALAAAAVDRARAVPVPAAVGEGRSGQPWAEFGPAAAVAVAMAAAAGSSASASSCSWRWLSGTSWEGLGS